VVHQRWPRSIWSKNLRNPKIDMNFGPKFMSMAHQHICCGLESLYHPMTYGTETRATSQGRKVKEEVSCMRYHGHRLTSSEHTENIIVLVYVPIRLPLSYFLIDDDWYDMFRMMCNRVRMLAPICVARESQVAVVRVRYVSWLCGRGLVIASLTKSSGRELRHSQFGSIADPQFH